jgi:hypothetical protein
MLQAQDQVLEAGRAVSGHEFSLDDRVMLRRNL